jgi:hypothetical protein
MLDRKRLAVLQPPFAGIAASDPRADCYSLRSIAPQGKDHKHRLEQCSQIGAGSLHCCGALRLAGNGLTPRISLNRSSVTRPIRQP